jgi:hypothetical protein
LIYVLTAHVQTGRWVDIQLDHLERYLDRPHRVVADLEGVNPAVEARFDVVTHLSAEAGRTLAHDEKLNRLAALVASEAARDDMLLFLDGDAFPVAPIGDFIEQQLVRFPLAAVRRDESVGDVQPHPSFCITTVGFWQEIGGDWSHGPEWTWADANGRPVDDVGGKLLWLLRERGVEWGPLLRTNRRNMHPVLFGVYEDRVYHHGAGFRPPIERVERHGAGVLVRLPKWLPPDPPASPVTAFAWKLRAKFWYLRDKRPVVKRRERLARRNQKLSDRVFASIGGDPDFWRHL